MKPNHETPPVSEEKDLQRFYLRLVEIAQEMTDSDYVALVAVKADSGATVMARGNLGRLPGGQQLKVIEGVITALEGAMVCDCPACQAERQRKAH